MLSSNEIKTEAVDGGDLVLVVPPQSGSDPAGEWAVRGAPGPSPAPSAVVRAPPGPRQGRLHGRFPNHDAPAPCKGHAVTSGASELWGSLGGPVTQGGSWHWGPASLAPSQWVASGTSLMLCSPLMRWFFRRGETPWLYVFSWMYTFVINTFRVEVLKGMECHVLKYFSSSSLHCFHLWC